MKSFSITSYASNLDYNSFNFYSVSINFFESKLFSFYNLATNAYKSLTYVLSGSIYVTNYSNSFNLYYKSAI